MPAYLEGVVFSGAVETLRWGDFITIVNTKGLTLQYAQGTDTYTIWAVDGQVTYTCLLVFAASSGNYPFPYPDGYTVAQNNTDVGTFTSTYQSTANLKTNINAVGGIYNSSLPTLTTGTSGLIQLDSNGRILVSSIANALPAGANVIGAVTQSGTWNIGTVTTLTSITNPVAVTQSGTWTTGRTWTLASGTDSVAAVQSGTWTVQPGNTPNTTPWLTTDTSDGPVTPGTAATKSQLGGMQYNSSAPAPTTGQQLALQSDSAGNLLVNLKTSIPAGSNTIGAVTQGTSPWVDNLSQVGGTAVVTGGLAGSLGVGGLAAAGAALSGNPVRVGGSDGTDIQDLSVTVKGTQGARGVATQDLKDGGRTYVVLSMDNVAGITAEALGTLSINKGGTVTSATSYTVTAGKTLRIQAVNFGMIVSSGTNDGHGVLRTAASGISITSAVLAVLVAGNSNGTGTNNSLPIPDGLEIAGGQQIAFSHVESSTSTTVSATIVAYEY